MNHEEQLSPNKTRCYYGILLLNQLIMLSSGGLLIYFSYQLQTTHRLLSLISYIGYSGVLFTAFVSLFFVSISFRRLNKCLENHD